MQSRRRFLGRLFAGTAAAAVTAKVAVGVEQRLRGDLPAATSGSEPSEAPSGPWWLLHPLVPGASVGLGWHVGHFSDVERGAAVLTLARRDGETARVHLCAHDGRPRGLAHTAFLDLILMDGGDGGKPTDESIGRVLLALADRIRENEVSREGDLRPLARMMTHEDRVLAFGPDTLT